MKPPSTSVEGNSSHGDNAILVLCPICSLGFSYSGGLERHLAGHKRNPTAHLAHLVGAIGFKCGNCAAEFGTQIGLFRHHRRAHPAEYNDEKLARRPVSQYNWFTLEDATLGNMATELYGSSGTKGTPIFLFYLSCVWMKPSPTLITLILFLIHLAGTWTT
ncbi:hypothetical protein PHET_11370 [Paragonimus heterotremus]|uniref:C2H2-type domain-containing protein n=1 Tax=Paragonimus heterotremus TaxID=100268 RepID=A0A8J4STA0_9TREM|nr:hypothetical protein PHET_11370 [Paragonimus heterotremus]